MRAVLPAFPGFDTSKIDSSKAIKSKLELLHSGGVLGQSCEKFCREVAKQEKVGRRVSHTVIELVMKDQLSCGPIRI